MPDDLLVTVKAEHELKCWPEYFQAVLSGDKPFEVRNNDRDFKVGDTLWLREWGPVSGYTGNEIRLRVTYMLEGPAFGIAAGYVVMGLESALAAEVERLRDRLCLASLLMGQLAYYRTEQTKNHRRLDPECDCYACAGLDHALRKGAELEDV